MTPLLSADSRAPRKGLAAAGVILGTLLATTDTVRSSGSAESQVVAVKAGRIITVTGDELAPGVIVIEDGVISAVGADLEYPSSALVIDASRETVTPGLIAAQTRYGLESYSRAGVHGDESAATEVYLSEIDFLPLLEAGYTTVAYTPSGKGIPGMAVAYRTAGAEESRRVGEAVYLYANPDWSTKGTAVLRGALKKAKSELEKIEKARKEWEEQQKEKEKSKEGEEPKEEEKQEKKGEKQPSVADEGDSDEPKDEDKKEEETEFVPPKTDAKHQPLMDWIEEKDGTMLTVGVGKASDVLHLHGVIESYRDLPLTYILESTTWRTNRFHPVVKELGDRTARVVLSPRMHRLPYTTFRSNLMADLVQAGCEVSIVPRSDSRQAFLSVRRHVSELTRSGVARDRAMEAMTINPAKALGLEEQIGGIEEKRKADLTFFDGDPFDGHSRVTRVMILGELVWEAP